MSQELVSVIERLIVSLDRLSSRLDGGPLLASRSAEDEAIEWLLQRVATGGDIPSLSSIARENRVDRRMLRKDKWTRFRSCYEKLMSLEVSLRRAQAAAFLSGDE